MLWSAARKKERDFGAGDPFTRILAPSQSQVFQADTTGQLVHIGMQAQRADTEAGPFVRVSFVLTGASIPKRPALHHHLASLSVSHVSGCVCTLGSQQRQMSAAMCVCGFSKAGQIRAIWTC